MPCQACNRPAAGHAKRHGLTVACCGAECGRLLLSGITAVDDAIHIASASPLGNAIASRANIKRDTFVFPPDIAAQLVGALQRIGPKRPAEGADLPASTQTDAPPGTAWVAGLPQDIWENIILPQVSSETLHSFAGVNRRSYAIARSDRLHAIRFRQSHTAFQAASLYMAPNTNDTRRRVIRMAFRDAPEMALALMLLCTSHEISSHNFTPEQAVARIQTLRLESGRVGDALYQTPIMLPVQYEVMANGIDVPDDGAVPVLARAIRFYTKRINPETRISEEEEARRFAIRRETKPGAKFPYETPTSPSFFNMPHIMDFSQFLFRGNEFLPSLEKQIRHGIDISRYDAAAWIYVATSFLWEPMSAISTLQSTPNIRFDTPRTLPGQKSALFIATTLGDETYLGEYIDLLKRKGVLTTELVQSVELGHPGQYSIIYYGIDMSEHTFSRIVFECYQFQQSLLWDPAVDGLRPFEHYIADWAPRNVIRFMSAAPEGSAGFMAWHPFDPAIVGDATAPPRILALPLDDQYELVRAILEPGKSSIESIDESHELLEYAQYLAEWAQDAHDNGNLDDVVRIHRILKTIVKALPGETSYATEYNQIYYDGMHPRLRFSFMSLAPPGTS